MKTEQQNNLFKTAGLMCYTHRFKTLAICLLLTLLAFQSFPRLRMDVSIEGFLKPDDPVLAAYNRFRADFDNDELIVVGIEGDRVFDPAFLEKLNRLHHELEENVPYVDEITSLINVRNTRGQGDTLIVEDLFEQFPGTGPELDTLKRRTAQNRLYKNLVISEDMRTTAIVIRLLSFSPGNTGDIMQEFENTGLPGQNLDHRKKLTVAESGAAVEKARNIVQAYQSGDFRVFLSGAAAVDHFLVTIIPKDTKKFMMLAYLTVIVLLGLIFRRVSGILIPVAVVSLTLIFTLALFALSGVTIKLPTQTLPSFLLAVSVCYSVHILALFHYRRDRGEPRKQALGRALSHSGKAIVLTGITTAAGLLSFSGSKNAPISELGLFAGSGVCIAVLLTFILVPALVSFIPEKKTVGHTRPSALDRLLTGIAAFATGHYRLVLATAFLVLLVCAAGISQIRFSHNTLKWLPETAAIRMDTEYLDRHLKGTVSMEVIIDTQKENGLYDPALLRRMDAVSQEIQDLSTDRVATGKAWSLVEIIKETNQALHGNDPSRYTIPDSRDLLVQELFLFSNSGSDDLEDFTDSGFSKARISVKLPFVDAIAYHGYIQKVDALLKKEFPGISVTTTGLVMIYARVIANTISDMKISYAVAVCAVTLMMIFLIGNIRMGLISMIPNLFPIIVVIGVAGFLQVPFSLFIMLIGNIVIGLAVDDTIHFMHNFNTCFQQGLSCKQSVENTLLTSGRAMLLTTLILCSAFFIYLFSSLNHLNHFGILAGLAVIFALVADFFVTPALMTYFYGRTPLPEPDPASHQPAVPAE